MSDLESRLNQKKPKFPKKHFTNDEDSLLRLLFCVYYGDWRQISMKMEGRSPRQCRDRYVNYLDPCVKNNPWSEVEDNNLIKLLRMYGKKWSLIARHFPGRTDNNVKNRFYKHIKKSMNPILQDVSTSIIEFHEDLDFVNQCSMDYICY